MKTLRLLSILLLGFIMLSCSRGGTYRLYLRYQPPRDFPTLQEKVGPSLAVAPFKDERADTLYLGFYAPLAGSFLYFRSDPFPLEKAMTEMISQVPSQYGIKTVAVSNWDGQPDSVNELETDSVLMIQIKRFWIEGNAGPLGTDITASINLVFHLGVKKEKKVFTRNIDLERKMKDTRLTPGLAEQTINRMLEEIFDTYFSNPY